MSKSVLDQRWPWLLTAATVVLIFLSTFVRWRSPQDWDPRPTGSAKDIELLAQRDDLNVLFILVDTLRADRLGSYGYERETSPHLDTMAASGVRFARHLAQSSWTKASMASMWTSLLPTHTGITRFDHVIPEDALMPAEIFRDAGYQTVGLYRNGWVAPTFGFDQGFDVYERPLPVPLPPGVRRKNPTVTEAGTDESAVASALEFLRFQGSNKWFLYMHFMDVHEYLYDESSSKFGTRYTDVYDNSILWTDGTLQRLMEALAESGSLENTLIVLTSDHGEAFGEHGFEGHARKVYRETSEVPFFIFFPFRIEPGLVVPSRTSNIDIWPTVFDLLGLEIPSGDGRSRVPEIMAAAAGTALPEQNTIAIAHLDQTWARPAQSPQPTVAVVDGDLRYIRIDQPEGRVEQLFDAVDDPLELRDRAADFPGPLVRLAQEAEAYLDEKPIWGEAPTRELDELELNHLRALGYALP